MRKHVGGETVGKEKKIKGKKSRFTRLIYLPGIGMFQ